MGDFERVAIAAVCAVVAATVVFGHIRGEWLYRVRVRLIDEDFATYQRLPSWRVMFWRFWVWDVTAFLRGGDHG